MDINITMKYVLDSKPLSDGRHSMYLRLIKDRKRKNIAIGIRCKSEHFQNEQLSKKHSEHKLDNAMLLTLKSKALKIIRDFQLENHNFTLEEFEQKFRGKEKSQKVSVILFFDEIIEELEISGRIGNAKAYRETREALRKFSGDNLLFQDITPAFLEKFEAHMRSIGNENGGIAFKMRELRAILNKAISRKIINRDLYPFGEYKIARLKTNPNKRALSIEDFKKIREVDLSERPDLLEAYNYFMFSFYARGINFVDILKLKWSNIQDGRIYYTRSKTKGQFSIEITEKVQEILDYYKAQNRLTEYVFPILLRNDLTPKQIENRRHKVLSRFNRKLQEIAKIAGVEKRITSYVARHSFATILKQMGTSTDVISELMGHSDVQVTISYLKEFDNEVLDNENRKLLNI
ncbi:site-specific integrase [Fluviicola sp. SGL-29]|nr:site-specific integrase [Fluviicola sp. SGL-29]